jgi:hypothetical protein
MDTFERKETFKFTSLLRVKLREQRKNGKAIEPVQIYDKVKQLQEDELKDIGRRNAQIRRSYEMEQKGLTVNYTLFDEEAEMFRRMRHSQDARYPALRRQFWSLCQAHLDKPAQLASDYVMARVYKHCCILLDLESILGNKEIENEFYQFKDMFNTRARKQETKDKYFAAVR